jgi:hypothetical protein
MQKCYSRAGILTTEILNFRLPDYRILATGFLVIDINSSGWLAAVLLARGLLASGLPAAGFLTSAFPA